MIVVEKELTYYCPDCGQKLDRLKIHNYEKTKQLFCRNCEMCVMQNNVAGEHQDVSVDIVVQLSLRHDIKRLLIPRGHTVRDVVERIVTHQNFDLRSVFNDTQDYIHLSELASIVEVQINESDS